MKKLLTVVACVMALAGCMTTQSNEESMARKIAERYRVLSVADWHGGRRIEFDFEGYNAWLVCPPSGTAVAEGRPWT